MFSNSFKTKLKLYLTGRGRRFIRLLASASLVFLAAYPAPDTRAELTGLNLQIDRAGHTATVLPSGQVVIIGGESATGPESQAEVYDSTAHTLSAPSGAQLLVPRADHAATALADGKVLVTGGRDKDGPLASTEVFDPATGQFSDGPAMNHARAGHSATALSDGKILIAGGDAAGTAEVLDAGTFTLIELPMTASRAFHGTALLPDGKVLLAGGLAADGTAMSSAEVFDPAAMSFAPIASAMHSARVSPTMRVLPDGKVQVIGGADDGTLEIYDPAINAFGAYAKVLNPLNTANDVLSAQTRSGLIFKGSSLSDSLLDQLVNRDSYSLTEIPQANQALVAGGIDNANQVLSSAFVLDSSAAIVTTDQLDYAPGTVVTITGKGWQPGETVTMGLYEEPNNQVYPSFSALADANGSFEYMDFAPNTQDIGVAFTLTAKGVSSGFTAQTAFTDAAAAANVTFTTDTSCPVNVNVTNFTNNGGQTGKTAQGPTPLTIGTKEGTSVALTYQSSVVCTGTTYNFDSASPNSPLTSGASSTTTSVLGHYVAADSTAPQVNITFTPNGQNGWFVTSPAVGSVTAADSESNVTDLSCTGATLSNVAGLNTHNASGTLTVTAEGDTSVSCTAKSTGGTSSPASVSVHIDSVKPTITAAATTSPNSSGWYNSDVTVHFTCSDTGSGISDGACPADQVLSTEGSSVSSTAQTVTDKAGNVSAASNVVTVKIDKTPPTITRGSRTPANGYGWNNGSVTVTWSCTDNLSGAVASNVIQTVSGEGANQSANGTCTDLAGNSATDTQAGINIDLTPPTLSPRVSPNPVVLNGTATVSANASDSLSRVASSSCNPVDTSSVGSKSVACTATDEAGNSASASASYSVIYRFDGFLQPINDTGRPSACPTPCPISVFNGWQHCSC